MEALNSATSASVGPEKRPAPHAATRNRVIEILHGALDKWTSSIRMDWYRYPLAIVRLTPGYRNLEHYANQKEASLVRLLPSFAAAYFLCVVQPVQGQLTMPETASEAPQARATHSETAPTMDGDVMGDPAYALSEPIIDFWQTTPNHGNPASERTEVRVLYTDRALYIGVVCYDREPDRIIVADSRRDAPLDETDSFTFILDTFLDGQNGFVFGTNPAGIEFDAQVTKEGQGGFFGRQQTGSGGGFNINWDGSLGRAHPDYRYRVGAPNSRYRSERCDSLLPILRRGGQFQRNIRRHNEQSFWHGYPAIQPVPRLARRSAQRPGCSTAAQSADYTLCPWPGRSALSRSSAQHEPGTGSWRGSQIQPDAELNA